MSIRMKYLTTGSAVYGFRILTGGNPFTARPATASGAVENQTIPESASATVLDFTPSDGAGQPWGIPIAAGERLAVHISTTGVRPIAVAPEARVQRTSFDHSSGSASYNTASFGPGQVDRELLLQGTVEPDADGDRYGDESQDNCVGSAGPFKGCPSELSLAKAKGKKGKVIVTATIPGAGTLSAGSASDRGLATTAKARPPLKRVTKTLTSTTKQQVTLTLNLTKAAKSKLARKGKLGLKVKVVYTPTGGSPSSRTTKTKLREAGPS